MWCSERKCPPDIIKDSDLVDYIEGMYAETQYGNSIKTVDMRDICHKGGSTASSGVLPKWDLTAIGVFLKTCSVDTDCRWLADAWHESYVSDLFRDTGVHIARAVPIYIWFYNPETGQTEIRPGEAAIKFTENITCYKTWRESKHFDPVFSNDVLVEFSNDFSGVAPGIVNMFTVDYITNQEDRHAKNFGVTEAGVLSDLFDNGACFNYTVLDNLLPYTATTYAKSKLLAIDAWDVLTRYAAWFHQKPTLDFGKVLSNLATLKHRYADIISTVRLDYNQSMAERRIGKCMAHFI